MNEQVVRDLADLAARMVDQIIPAGEGACLGTCAVLARTLNWHFDIPTTAVQGGYDEHEHWWLETADLRIDPTRAQFDAGPLVERLADVTSRDEDPYASRHRFPAWWTFDQAVEEFARMFVHRDIGERHGLRIIAALLDAAADMKGATCVR